MYTPGRISYLFSDKTGTLTQVLCGAMLHTNQATYITTWLFGVQNVMSFNTLQLEPPLLFTKDTLPKVR